MKPRQHAQVVEDTDITYEELHRLFDNELDEDAAQALRREVERLPGLELELEQLGQLRGVLVANAEATSAMVPQARFEQIWDRIEREIDQVESQEVKPASWWSQLWARLKPVQVPALAAVGAAAVVLVLVRGGANNSEEAPSVATTVGQPTPMTSFSPPHVAKPSLNDGQRLSETEEADTVIAAFPEPRTGGETEIHGIEFGGQQGRVAQTGTVTVLYVEEDIEPQSSERSL